MFSVKVGVSMGGIGEGQVTIAYQQWLLMDTSMVFIFLIRIVNVHD